MIKTHMKMRWKIEQQQYFGKNSSGRGGWIEWLFYVRELLQKPPVKKVLLALKETRV